MDLYETEQKIRIYIKYDYLSVDDLGYLLYGFDRTARDIINDYIAEDAQDKYDKQFKYETPLLIEKIETGNSILIDIFVGVAASVCGAFIYDVIKKYGPRIISEIYSNAKNGSSKFSRSLAHRAVKRLESKERIKKLEVTLEGRAKTKTRNNSSGRTM